MLGAWKENQFFESRPEALYGCRWNNFSNGNSENVDRKVLSHHLPTSSIASVALSSEMQHCAKASPAIHSNNYDGFDGDYVGLMEKSLHNECSFTGPRHGDDASSLPGVCPKVVAPSCHVGSGRNFIFYPGDTTRINGQCVSMSPNRKIEWLKNHMEQQSIHLRHNQSSKSQSCFLPKASHEAAGQLCYRGADQVLEHRLTTGQKGFMVSDNHGNVSELPASFMRQRDSPHMYVWNMNPMGFYDQLNVQVGQQIAAPEDLVQMFQSNVYDPSLELSGCLNRNEGSRMYTNSDDQSQKLFILKAKQHIMQGEDSCEFQSQSACIKKSHDNCFITSDNKLFVCNKRRKIASSQSYVEASKEDKNLAFGSSAPRKAGQGVNLEIVHKLLLLYDHAKYCSVQGDQCTLKPKCAEMKNFLHHLCICYDINCHKNCSKYRRLFNHFDNCDGNCLLCHPVKQILARRGIAAASQAEDSFLPKSTHIGVPQSSPVSGLTQLSETTSPDHKQGPGEFLLIEHQEVKANEDRSVVLADEIKTSLSRGSSTDGCSRTDIENINGSVSHDPIVMPPIPEEKICKEPHENVELLLSKPNGANLFFESKEIPLMSNNFSKSRIQCISLIESFTHDKVLEHIKSLKHAFLSNRQSEVFHSNTQATDNCKICSLCGHDALLFEPPPRYCERCYSQIKLKGVYYHTKETNAASRSFDVPKYFCGKCYKNSKEAIEISNESIPKSELERRCNYAEICAQMESWVQCEKCEAWQHQICSLFNGKRSKVEQFQYICPECHLCSVDSEESEPSMFYKALGAKELPTNKLSDHIEKWLTRRLQDERQKRAVHMGKCFDEVPGAEGLVVRVVSSVDKSVEVKPHFREAFREYNYPLDFPYKSKVILLFQNIDGADVCLFSMYVHEFGSKCDIPNQRHVVLSYIDSVKYFRPEVKSATGEALRTFVYHEILVGYLDYCKKRGFVNFYIWACVPKKGDNYILYCHPRTQKMPKSDKLRDWYRTIIRKGVEEKIVVGHTDIHTYFFEPHGDCRRKASASHLPYFDGDFWTGRAEVLLENDINTPEMKGKRSAVDRTLRAAKRDASSGNPIEISLMYLLGEAIRPSKDDFFLVHLHYSCNHCYKSILGGKMWACGSCKNFQLCGKCHDVEQRKDKMDRHPVDATTKHSLHLVDVEMLPAETSDEDGTMESETFDSRLVFLGLCQENNYQFGSLRRAKHATMMILYHLHEEQKQREEKMKCVESTLKNSSIVMQEQHVLDLLVHASKCLIRDCKYHLCRNIKVLFHHGSICKIRVKGDCLRCKRMWYLLRKHASTCLEPVCHVPRCKDLRKDMEEKKSGFHNPTALVQQESCANDPVRHTVDLSSVERRNY